MSKYYIIAIFTVVGREEGVEKRAPVIDMCLVIFGLLVDFIEILRSFKPFYEK